MNTAQLALSAILFTLVACGRGQVSASSVQPDILPRVANLHAFARLYGVVRWFHPSDAAAVLDWDRFAIDGVRSVVDAPDARVLRMRLTELFKPVAPTMHIAATGEAFPDEPTLHPKSGAALDLIAWQHKGYGDSTIATGYASKRRHRDRTVAQAGALFAALSQSIDAAPLRGARVRLRGKLRTGGHARGQLWLRVDRGDVTGFFDNMAKHPLVSDTWASAEIIGTVASDATRIVIGVLNESSGPVWYDDLELSVETTDHAWRPIEVQDASFETSDPLTSWHMGIGRLAPATSIDAWNVVIDHGISASGSSSLRVEPVTIVITKELFDPFPEPSETFDVDLGSGLRARVPLSLYAKDNQTIGDDPDIARHAQAPRSPSPTGFDPLAGAADVIVFWNVFEHFWPYWDTVSVDRSAMLDLALARSIGDHSVDDHVATLERLSTAAPDGHVRIACPGEIERGYPPFAVDLVESQVVVTSSANPAIERGDVLLSIDGHPARHLLDLETEYVSGSPQWRMVGALQRLGTGPLGTTVSLQLRRGNDELNVTTTRVDQGAVEIQPHSPVERLHDETYYVDLSRATMTDIDTIIDQLARAPGVVFDLRGYPRRNHQVLSYILSRPDDLKGWESIPLIIRPDSASTPAGWEDTSTWNMPLLSIRQPHISGRVAFLTGPRAISYAESVMALVEYFHLGEIVGSPTAGTNGDIARITLPTGCTTYFTGRRVTNPDGTRHHLVGVQPTLPASRTIAGVIAGRDEVLEKALAYVRTGAK